ncbi:MAG: septum formation initiator family protein [Fimbriimonadaceae bacterium]|nr:septum formation initiator family protein [Chitinophagales bacterium]
MISIKNIRERIRLWNVPKFFRNKFVFTFFIFIAWMLFFDQNNFFVQFGRMQDLRSAKQKKEFYETETKTIQQQITALLNDKRSLEKFAREKYYMKKPNEDVFVIVEKK